MPQLKHLDLSNNHLSTKTGQALLPFPVKCPRQQCTQHWAISNLVSNVFFLQALEVLNLSWNLFGGNALTHLFLNVFEPTRKISFWHSCCHCGWRTFLHVE
jgi:hypothetical protein